MASVKKSPKTKAPRQKAKSEAQKNLEYALGENMVSFGDLFPSEQNEKLRSALQGVDLREMRGFTPLYESLTFRPGSSTYGGERFHTLDVETLGMDAEAVFFAHGFDESSTVDKDTHVMSLSRGWLSWLIVFKRNETGEETEDYAVASEWGRSAYHHSGTAMVIALRRPRNHTGASENLILIKFWYEKVPLKDRHVIVRMNVEPLTLGKMREYFGSSYPKVVVGLIHELRIAYSRTLSELKSQCSVIQAKATELERLSGAITS